MGLVQFTSERDKQRMLALAYASTANNIHIADWPYRFASWAFDEPDNIGLWVNDQGDLVAWTVLQTPFWVIDYVLQPDLESAGVHRAMLAWTDMRARAVLNTRFGRPMWFVGVRADQVERIRDLEALGFANQADVGADAWSKVLLAHTGLVPNAHEDALPSGFVIHRLPANARGRPTSPCTGRYSRARA